MVQPVPVIRVRKIVFEYMEKFGSIDGAKVAKATEKIGFAKEKLGQPSAMLKLYFEDIRKFGNNPTNLGVDDISKNTVKNINTMKTSLVRHWMFWASFKSRRISIIQLHRPQRDWQQVSGTIEKSFWTGKKPFLLSSQYKGRSKNFRKSSNIGEEYLITLHILKNSKVT